MRTDSTPAQTDEARREVIAQRFLEEDYEGTLSAFEAYLADYPRDTIAWTIVGHAYRELNRADEAERAYDRALYLDPRCIEAMTSKGIVHRIRGEYDQAMACYEGAIAIEPTYAPAYSSMMMIAIKRGDDSQALRYAQRAFELNHHDPVIISNLAVAHHYVGNEAERDRFARMAQAKGYRRMESIHKIFSGELSLRD